MRKKIKNVNVKNCFNTLILSLIGLLLVFTPFVFGNGKLLLLLDLFPFFGKKSISSFFDGSLLEFLNTFLSKKMSSTVLDILFIGFDILPLVFFGILILDIIFAIILMTTRLSFFRVLFKILSIIMGIILIITTLVSLIYISSCITLFAIGDVTTNELLCDSGIISISLVTIYSPLIIAKQFTWYKRLY